MKAFVDRFLNAITMYKLALYGLLVIIGAGLIVSAQGLLGFSMGELLLSVLVLGATCYVLNLAMAKAYGTVTASESALITALILACILPPARNGAGLLALVGVGALAMVSKYVLAFGRRHIFNPAAVAAVLATLLGLSPTTWWVSSLHMLPVVAVVSLLIVYKTKRSLPVSVFLVIGLAVILWLQIGDGVPATQALSQAFTSWPLVFFAGVMFTEPLTFPESTALQLAYAVVVGLLFAARWHIGSLYSAPEVALVAGNIFSFVSGRKTKPGLRVLSVEPLSPTVYEVILQPSKPFSFIAGQYMELTVGHKNPDQRGNRRTFSLAASPSEPNLRVAFKVPERPSSFKQALIGLKPETVVGIGAVGGHFVLPAPKSQKLLFLASGIGITPFRSMIQHLVDANEKRDIVLLYFVTDPEEILYPEVWKAAQRCGVKVIELIGEQRFRLSETKKLLERVPDYQQRLSYLSGSPGFVEDGSRVLKKAGLPTSQIKTDYFIGY